MACMMHAWARAATPPESRGRAGSAQKDKICPSAQPKVDVNFQAISLSPDTHVSKQTLWMHEVTDDLVY